MPLVEFECAGCGERFEDLVRGEESSTCPGCGGRRLRRMLSAFGVGAAKAPAADGPCGGCQDPGACGRDG